MRGACKDSKLGMYGKVIMKTSHLSYLLLMPTALPDTKYQIRNVDSFVGLNGFTSTIIRQEINSFAIS